MQKGCIQLYYGDGKGKTTAAMGQIVRCVGHGFKVLVYQFLKEPNSGEVSVIRSLPGVDYIENEGPIPFMFNLTPEQQEFYKEKFQKNLTRSEKNISPEIMTWWCSMRSSMLITWEPSRKISSWK